MLVAIVTLPSCIDSNYDLTNVDTDDITFGGNLSLPLGNIIINVDKILTGLPPGEIIPPGRYPVREVKATYGYDFGDKNLTNTIPSTSSVTLSSTISNPFNIKYKVTVNIGDVTLFEDAIVDAGVTTSLPATKISIADIESISTATEMRVFLVPMETSIIVPPGGLEKLSVNIFLGMKILGGIKI